MDKKETLKSIVVELLEKGFGDRYKAEFTDISDTELKVDITGEGVSYLIGQFGKTLLAFQLLVRQIYMNKTEDYSEDLKILIDVDGYKVKRIEKIKEIAKNAADRAISLGQQVTLPVMNAFERHVVHDYINEIYPDMQTGSVGEEPNRRVALTPGQVVQ
jgi:spoIIIJ-associated protein